MKTQNFNSSVRVFASAICTVLTVFFLTAFGSPAMGQGYFEEGILNPFGFNFTPSESDLVFHTLVDIDNDGDLDDFVSHREYIQPCWMVSAFDFYENQGTSEVPEFVKIQGETFGLPTATAAITFVDIDDDGDPDAFISDHCFQSTITFHENTGSANQPQFSSTPTQTMGSITGIGFAMLAFGDLDGDGDYDALINGMRPAQFVYLENTGTPASFAYTLPVINPFGLSIPSFNSSEWSQFVDWDCDGDLDILNSHWQGTTHNDWLLYLYENNGSPAAPSFLPPVATNQLITAIALGDMDSDGDVDIFADEYYFKNITTTGCLTAVGQRENGGQISIFPNPVSNFLTVKIDGEMSMRHVKIEVLNSLGEVITLTGYEAPDFSAGVRMNVSDLGSGFYTLKINGGGRFLSEKFLKVE